MVRDPHRISVFGSPHCGDRRPGKFRCAGSRAARQHSHHAGQHLQEGSLGFRFHPIKPLTILADGEFGRNNQPYTPISDKNYQTFRARAEYKQKTFRVGANAKTDYNNNSITLTSFASRSRNYGADFSWTPKEWFAIDASYNKLHLNTTGRLVLLRERRASELTSIYISNIHAGNLGARFALGKRADVYVGYTHTQDVGDGRSTATGNSTDTGRFRRRADLPAEVPVAPGAPVGPDQQAASVEPRIPVLRLQRAVLKSPGLSRTYGIFVGSLVVLKR